MTNLVNLNSYVPPVPIPPVAPNFVFCSEAYGTGLIHDDALKAGGLLPQGRLPVTYSVEGEEIDGLAVNVSALEADYHLPLLEYSGGAWLSVDVSGPVDINSINVVPNDIRGMAGYVASQCVGRHGVGGFVTKKIQGLVDFVTDPTSNIDDTPYPDSTAFLTLTLSTLQTSHSFPGDYDPQLALFLQEAEADALRRVEPRYHAVIVDRIVKFAQVRSRMRRLETEVPWWVWWAGWLGQGQRTAIANVQLANKTRSLSRRRTHPSA